VIGDVYDFMPFYAFESDERSLIDDHFV
jgi:hypothetical protein